MYRGTEIKKSQQIPHLSSCTILQVQKKNENIIKTMIMLQTSETTVHV